MNRQTGQIGQAELAEMDLDLVPPEAETMRDEPEQDWLERHPGICGLVAGMVFCGTPVVLLAILYAIGKARGM